MLCLLQIVNASGIAPAVGGKKQRSDIVQLTVGCRTLGVACSVCTAAPCKVTLQRTVLMLHILLTPAPKPVKNILAVKLHGNHHAIRHALSAHIVVLHITPINDMARAGKAVIVISSEMQEIIGTCDRAYIINEGRIAGELSHEELSQESIMKCIMDSNAKGEE